MKKMIFLLLLLFASPAWAVDPIIPPLPWESPINCPTPPDFTYNSGNPGEFGCEGIGFFQNPGDDGLGHYTTFAVANNRPGSTGGGYRQWLGLVKNQSSPGPAFNFKYGGGSPSREETQLNVRFYIRYMSGLDFGATGDAGTKIIFMQISDTPGSTGSMWFEGNRSQFRWTDGLTNVVSTGFGLPELWGGQTGDGAWHCMEVQYKTETSLGAGNGIVKAWIDGVLRVSGTGITTGSASIPAFTMPSNNHEVFNAGGAYIDFDDVKITNDGVQIGCLDGGGAGSSGPTARSKNSKSTRFGKF